MIALSFPTARHCGWLALLLTPILAAGCASRSGVATSIDARTQERLAATAQSAGDTRSAVAFLAAAAASDPDPAVQMKYAASLAAAGQHAEAVRIALRTSQGRPKDIAFAREAGRICVAARDGDAAAQTFRAILAREPRNVEALNGLGIAYALQGRMKAARDSFGMAAEIDPADLPTRNNLALSYTLTGDVAKAIDLLRPISVGSDAPERVRHNLALAYSRRGDTAAARAALAPELGTDAAGHLAQSYATLAAPNNALPDGLASVQLWDASTPPRRVSATSGSATVTP